MAKNLTPSEIWRWQQFGEVPEDYLKVDPPLPAKTTTKSKTHPPDSKN